MAGEESKDSKKQQHERLAAALRANLRRRKEQTRGRDAAAAEAGVIDASDDRSPAKGER